MKPLDLSLYLVLDPDLCEGAAGMIRTAQIAATQGITVVQLRAPNWKKRLWFETALELKRVLAPHGVPLIINDHVDIALAVDADGVHLGQADLPVHEARMLIGPDKWLGLSISNAEELARAPLELVDYLGVGPVYPTATKTDAAPALGLVPFAEMMKTCNRPVVAIGGIGIDNCSELLQAGAQGVAVVSAICGQNNIAQATRVLAQKIRTGSPIT